MHTWKAYFQINGYDFSRYPVVEFSVPDPLYAEMQTAVTKNRPLRDCRFYEDLLRLANGSLDLDEYRPDYADLFPDLSEVSVVSCVIDDPGDMKRFEDHIRGLRLPSGDLSCEDEECTRRYHIQVSLDDAGCITKVDNVQSEGLGSESVHSSSWESCYPDYNLIACAIEKECSHA